MNQGILYGVGVGPGDPELLTMKAVRILREADVIAAPDTGGEKTALGICKEYIAGKPILLCDMPMLRDKALLARKYDSAADEICSILDSGRNVAFITLGDPTVYSTYLYVHQRVRARGYTAELVPGVPSFCAAAARLGESLCEAAEPLTIIPASNREIDTFLDLPGTKVLMKTGRAMAQVKRTLSERRVSVQSVENCGLAGERVFRSLDEIDTEAGYFSIVVVKEKV